MICHDLDLDMARAFNEPLQKNAVVAKGLAGLILGRLERAAS